MTVSTTTSRIDYTGNGATLIFAVPFPFIENTDLVVLRTVIATGISTTLTLDSVGADGYSVTGAGTGTGSVTVVTAPASTERLSIIRSVPQTQDADFVPNDDLPAETLEGALDKAVMLIQQNSERLDRAITLPQSVSGFSTELPIPTADYLIAVNPTSTALTLIPPSTVASLGADFIQAGTGAVTRTVQAKLREEFSVDDFGAAGDGSDDSAAIQLALNSGAGGLVKFVPGKTYGLGSAVKVKSNTIIDARGATIRRIAAIDNMIRNDGDGTTGGYGQSENITIIGGTWDANGASIAGAVTPIAFGHATCVKVLFSTIIDVNNWHHIEFNGVQDGEAAFCTFYGSAGHQLDTAEAVQIDSNFGTGQFPWFGPSDSTRCENIRVHHNTFSGVGVGVGTHSSANGTVHQDIKIQDNSFYNCYFAGVRALCWSGVRITNNRFEGGYYGVYNQAASSNITSDWVVSGNTFYLQGYTTRAGTDARAFYADGDVGGTQYMRDFRIFGNEVLSCNNIGKSRHGITADYCRQGAIYGNTLRTIARAGIWVFGCDRVTVFGNEISSSNVEGTLAYGLSIGLTGSVNTTNINAHGNITDTASVSQCDETMFTGNIITTASGLTQSGNTSSAITGNSEAGVFKWSQLSGSLVVDPASLPAGTGANATVTVTGAEIGDVVSGVSFSQIQAGIMLTAEVTASNTVTVRIRNDSSGPIDLSNGTLRVFVNKSY